MHWRRTGHLTTSKGGVIRVVIASKNIPIILGFRGVGGGRWRALEGRNITDRKVVIRIRSIFRSFCLESHISTSVTCRYGAVA